MSFATDLILAQDGDVVVIPLALVRAIGLPAAAFLRQAAYLSAVVQDNGGWFFLEQEGLGDPTGKSIFSRLGSFQHALGIGPRAQVSIRQQLSALGLLEEKRGGMVHGKLQYRVDAQKYLSFLAQCGRITRCSVGQPAQSDCASPEGRLFSRQGAGCTNRVTSVDVYEVDSRSGLNKQHAPVAPEPADAAAPVEEPKRRHPRRTRNGIECWYPSEDGPADTIEALFTRDQITAAVAAVKSRPNAKGKRSSPVPILVADELERAHQVAENEAHRLAAEARRQAEIQALPSLEIQRKRIAELAAVFGKKHNHTQEITA